MKCKECREKHNDLDHRCVRFEMKSDRSGAGIVQVRLTPDKYYGDDAWTAQVKRFIQRFHDEYKAYDIFSVETRRIDYGPKGERVESDWTTIIARAEVSGWNFFVGHAESSKENQ